MERSTLWTLVGVISIVFGFIMAFVTLIEYLSLEGPQYKEVWMDGWKTVQVTYPWAPALPYVAFLLIVVCVAIGLFSFYQATK